MNFVESIKALKEGKKIRRKGWSKESFWSMDTGVLRNSKNELIDDWETVEGKKSLSDKAKKYTNGATGKISAEYEEEYVKESVKELIRIYPNDYFKEEVKKIFGERLV